MSQTITLQNEEVKVEISSQGAELLSIQDMKTQKEFLWCGDQKYWGRRSPILFPFVGSTSNKEYRTKEQTYQMTQHGFARDMEFETVQPVQAQEAWFKLDSNQETLVKYPYEFRLFSGYRLEGRTLHVLWKVENPSQETIYFSIGGHPGFYCPIDPQEKRTNYKIEFDCMSQIISTVITDQGLASDKKVAYSLENGRLPITERLFDHDALVIEGHQAHKVSLTKPDNTPYVTVKFDAPLFGIWSPAVENVPFICIEPWYGRCDHEAFTGTLEEREWGNKLLAGETWEASYTIIV